MTKLILPGQPAPLSSGPSLILPGENLDTQRYFAPQERVGLDLNRTAFDHTIGDLRAMGSWFRHPGIGRVPEPCLVIVPAKQKRLKDMRAIPTILLSQAWRWAPPPTGNPIWAAEQARDFCYLLGNKDPDNKAHVWQVMTLVLDHLDELVRIRPEPPAESRVVATIQGRIGDEVIEQEIRDHV